MEFAKSHKQKEKQNGEITPPKNRFGAWKRESLTEPHIIGDVASKTPHFSEKQPIKDHNIISD